MDSTESSDKLKVLKYVEQLLIEGQKILLAFDFDNTISSSGLSQGEDPRDTKIEVVIRDSLIRIKNCNLDMAIISARSGQKISQVVNIPELLIVGTLGWETFYKGISTVSDHFTDYRYEITKILKIVKEQFVDQELGAELNIKDDIEIELDFQESGKIILERKAVNEVFPEGIMHTYNLNKTKSGKREELINIVNSLYFQALKIEGISQEDLEFKKRCGVIIDGSTIQIGPISQQSKAHAMLQLLMQPNDPRRESYFSNFPGGYNALMYFGDSSLDQAVFEAGHLTEQLTQGYIDLQGVLVEGGKETLEKDLSDYKISGVNGNSELIEELASLIEKYRNAS